MSPTDDYPGLPLRDRQRLDELDRDISRAINEGLHFSGRSASAMASMKLDDLKKERAELLSRAGFASRETQKVNPNVYRAIFWTAATILAASGATVVVLLALGAISTLNLVLLIALALICVIFVATSAKQLR